MAEDLKNYTTGGLMSKLKMAIIDKVDNTSMNYYNKQSFSNPTKRFDTSTSLKNDILPNRSNTKID